MRSCLNMVSEVPIPLTNLKAGVRARLHQADVDSSTRRYLCAVGLTAACELRLCKAGEPCIVQVRATRIGLSKLLAGRILVVPLPGEAA